MYYNFAYRDASEALPYLLDAINRKGPETGSRAGRVRELTHVGITLNEPWRRELLVSGRKPNIAAQIAETMWVLGGRNDIEFLGHYLPRAKDFSDDGQTWRAGYGPRLRSWPPLEGHTEPIDQLRTVFEILRKDPLSRQAVMSIWDPALDYQASKDIPCNNWLNFSSRLGKLDLHVAIRSNDAMWGWSGINAFEWSALQEVLAGLLGIQVGGLHFSTTSFHLYDRHWAKAYEIIGAPEKNVLHHVHRLEDSPRFNAQLSPGRDALDVFDALLAQWFDIEQLIRTNGPHEQLVAEFPEPMLQSWLRVIQWWWTGEREYLADLEGTRLEEATRYSVQPPERETVELLADDQVVARLTVAPGKVWELPIEYSAFIEFAIKTHNEKHEAYGDSWKRRGEMLGIMANIARKVDRLGGSETADETSADTAMDLMVYLAKYRTWLSDQLRTTSFVGQLDSDTPFAANSILRVVEREADTSLDFDRAFIEEWLRKTFDRLEDAVTRKDSMRFEIVDEMLIEAYRLARNLWAAQQVAPAKEALKHRYTYPASGDDYRGADVD